MTASWPAAAARPSSAAPATTGSDGHLDNDLVDGGEGDDFVFGNSSDNTLLGGLGIDTLIGSWGVDSLDGGGQDEDDVREHV